MNCQRQETQLKYAYKMKYYHVLFLVLCLLDGAADAQNIFRTQKVSLGGINMRMVRMQEINAFSESHFDGESI
jgi:hypothetical protein